MNREHKQLINQVRTALKENPQLEQIMQDYMELSNADKDLFCKSIYSLLRAKTMN